MYIYVYQSEITFKDNLLNESKCHDDDKRSHKKEREK